MLLLAGQRQGLMGAVVTSLSVRGTARVPAHPMGHLCASPAPFFLWLCVCTDDSIHLSSFQLPIYLSLFCPLVGRTCLPSTLCDTMIDRCMGHEARGMACAFEEWQRLEQQGAFIRHMPDIGYSSHHKQMLDDDMHVSMCHMGPGPPAWGALGSRLRFR